jgi:hypothetical protein
MRRGGLVLAALVGVLVLAAGCGGGDGGTGNASATTAVPATTSAPGTTAAAGGGAEQELKLTAQGTQWDTTTLQLSRGPATRSR